MAGRAKRLSRGGKKRMSLPAGFLKSRNAHQTAGVSRAGRRPTRPAASSASDISPEVIDLDSTPPPTRPRQSVRPSGLSVTTSVNPPTRPPSNLFRYVSGFLLEPFCISYLSRTIWFDVSKDQLARLPSERHSLAHGDIQFRLRCIVLPAGHKLDERLWFRTSTDFPRFVALMMNGVEVCIDAARGVYISDGLREKGNTLSLTIDREAAEKGKNDYAIGIELITVADLPSLTTSLTIVPAWESRWEIQDILNRSTGGGSDSDNELTLTTPSLTIKLFEPLSGSKIFDNPVRRKDCLHRDCFDLGSFLSQCHRKQPHQPTVIDCWRCPICRGDVRPSQWIVDGFLVGVRGFLAAKGRLGTRAITVNADGSWEPVAEKLDTEQLKRTQAEAVDLDDDDDDEEGTASKIKVLD